MREMDLILGRFVEACLPSLPDDQLDDLEFVLEWPDPDLFAWIAGLRKAPSQADTPMLKRIAAFHRGGSERNI
jgi:antitoxin CptB